MYCLLCIREYWFVPVRQPWMLSDDVTPSFPIMGISIHIIMINNKFIWIVESLFFLQICNRITALDWCQNLVLEQNIENWTELCVHYHLQDQWQCLQQGQIWKLNFLAHLSQRLEAELLVYPWSGVRPSSSSVVHNFKHEYLCIQWADHNEILSEASCGWGKGCRRFWTRLDQNSGFHGNR